MSERLARYRIPGAGEHGEGGEVGVRFNITARMMACQAPGNWGPHDSEAFMTRHFYRSVLQRIFLDRGVIGRVFYGGEDEGGPTTSFTTEDNSLPTPTPAAAAPPPPNGTDSHNPLRFSTNPLILGSLPRRCFTSLPAYVRGAVAKLTAAAAPGEPAQHAACRARVAARMGADALTDGDMAAYEAAYGPRRRELEAVWSLMAFSAGVVESVIAVDRWLFLREQGPAVVRDCWVETLFEYGLSPRNLVVVGIKR
ncbi:hypothetical protein P8C59_001577 [Phyllachora maydis]|nr:hypothetical protein P8C59_001577 [Phyllachora maydis]